MIEIVLSYLFSKTRLWFRNVGLLISQVVWRDKNRLTGSDNIFESIDFAIRGCSTLYDKTVENDVEMYVCNYIAVYDVILSYINIV